MNPPAVTFTRTVIGLFLTAVVLANLSFGQKGITSPAESYYKRGIDKRLNGECGEAIKDFGRAIELKPNHAHALMERAQCFDELLEFEKAFADLGTAIKLNRRLDCAFQLRGDLYAKVGKFREAIADFTTVLRLVPNDHGALSSRAEAYREIGEVARAEVDERKADKAWKLIEEDPSAVPPTIIVEAIRRIPRKLLSEEDLANSYLPSMRGPVELVPDSAKEIRDLATENLEKLTKILQVNPDFAGAYFDRGYNQMKLGEFDKATADYSKAIALNPNYYQAFNNRGIACAKTGNYERAIADFTRAMSILPEDPSSHYNFGLVLLNKGSFQLSVNMLTGYIEKLAGDYKAHQLRALAYRKLGKTTEAEADETTARRIVAGN